MLADTIENRLFAEIQIGETAQFTHTVTAEDIDYYTAASGDVNPSHVDQAYAEERQMGRRVAHSLWGASLFSSLLGNVLPGPGTVYCSQTLDFHRPLYLGDSLTVTVTAVDKRPALKSILFDCQIRNQEGEVAVIGKAEVIALTVKIRRPRINLPGFEAHAQDRFRRSQGAIPS